MGGHVTSSSSYELRSNCFLDLWRVSSVRLATDFSSLSLCVLAAYPSLSLPLAPHPIPPSLPHKVKIPDVTLAAGGDAVTDTTTAAVL